MFCFSLPEQGSLGVPGTPAAFGNMSDTVRQILELTLDKTPEGGQVGGHQVSLPTNTVPVNTQANTNYSSQKDHSLTGTVGAKVSRN